MTQPESVLAECLDLWLGGADPTPVLSQHPDVAQEVASLLATAQRVRETARAFYVTSDVEHMRACSLRMHEGKRNAVFALLRRVLAMGITTH